MEKKRRPVITKDRPYQLRTEVPTGPNEEILNPLARAALRTELPAGQSQETINFMRPPRLRTEPYDGAGQEDLKEERVQYFFAGEWVPDQDPLLIGEQNYATLQNYRYRDLGLEGVQGYTKINPTAIPTYPRVRSAIQLRTPHTVPSYVLVHAENAAESASVVLKNTTAIPEQGDFAATPVWTDDVSAGAGVGRFSPWPNGDVGYCNGVETMIWGGSEQRLAAFIGCSGCGASLEDASDYTDEMQNTLQDADNIFPLDTAATLDHFVIGYTRPLQGFKVYVKTPNAAAGNLTIRYWNGTAWTAVAGLDDGTQAGGVTLAQTGRVKFTSTVDAAKVKFLEERLLYWYDVALAAGSADIYHVTVDAPPQKVSDIWDGVYRPVVGCYLHRFWAPEGGGGDAWVDYTMEAITETPAGWYPVHTLLEDGTPSTGYYYPGYYIPVNVLSTTPWSGGDNSNLEMAFEESTCALKVKLWGPGNTESMATNLTIQYWNGSDWVDVDGQSDGTKRNGRPLSDNGFISWTPPPKQERKRERFGINAYWYRMKVKTADGTLYVREGQHIWIDLIQGVPSPRELTAPFRFPFLFEGRAMMCAYTGAKEGNRVDYSMMHAPNVWNGEDSSDSTAGPLFFGSHAEKLTCACSIYNRFGSTVYNTAIFLKENETYLLNGYNADTWKIYPVSQNIGCPAPFTLATAEVGFGVSEEVVRNIAIWLSGDGPVVFDAGVILPAKQRIKCYFDRTDARCINYDEIDKAVGWVDTAHQEYNLLIPSGVGQTTNNVWLVMDLLRKRWYQKVPSAASNPYPMAATPVTDEHGNRYVYGFRDNGRMMRMDNGTTWDGGAIAAKVASADQVPGGDIWNMTEIRRFKIAFERVSESVALTIKHYANGCSAATSLESVSASSGSCRYIRDTQACRLQAWSHQFEVGASTSTEETGVPLLGWGYTVKMLRQDD